MADLEGMFPEELDWCGQLRIVMSPLVPFPSLRLNSFGFLISGQAFASRHDLLADLSLAVINLGR